jgi:hypothetical protein
MKSLLFKTIIITTVTSIIILTGCTKEFLEIKPINQVTEASFYADTNNILAAIAGAYNGLEEKDNPDIYDIYRMIMGDVAADGAEAGGDGGPLAGAGYSLDYDRLDMLPTQNYLADVYGMPYEGITRCNEIILHFPALKSIPKVNIANINHHLGEAYFLRAAYYFILTRTFGGVQIDTTILTPTQYNSVGRSTIKDIYKIMESDLKTAISLLPKEGEWPGTDNEGRATQGAAQALLAKMYVYESSYFTYYGQNDPRMGAVQNRWAEALAMCQQVINSGKYQLLGINGEKYSTFWTNNLPYTNGFRYLFSVEGNNNKESIFAVQHIGDIGGYNESVGNETNEWMVCPGVYTDSTLSSGSLIKDHVEGWGWFVPNHKLYNSFDSLDVRREVTFLKKGDSVWCAPTVKKVVTPGWYWAEPVYQGSTGFTTRKYEIGPFMSGIPGTATAPIPWYSEPQNMYYIRYADVILLASEAAMMTNDPGDALTYFNMIRKRARMCGNGVNPIDLVGPVTLPDIMDERFHEFAMEGERFFDLVRWHQAKNVINGSVLEGTGDVVTYTEPMNDFYPLPASVVQQTPLLQQYAGW